MQKLQNNSKNVLIISYIFPPASGIGGRRWAKFAKYLVKKNINVFVISTEIIGNTNSPWTEDVEGIKIKRLSTGYPKILSSNPKTIFQKFLYRLKLFQVKTLTKGNYFDKASFFESNLKKEIIDVVSEKKIQNIVVSGFPFNLIYFVCKLKPLLPGVKIISDFRDPWYWKKSYHIEKMPLFRQKEEQRKEQYVIEKSDLITVPALEMQMELCNIYKDYNFKIKLLEHGIDTDNIANIKNESDNNKIKFIMYGSIYTTIENEIELLADVFVKNQNTCELDIYSEDTKYKNDFEQKGVLDKNVFYHKSLHENQLYDKLFNSSYYLLICPNYAKDYLITKFYEIVYHRIPIIYIGENGLAGDFIQKNNLGIFIHKNDVIEGMQKIINGQTKLIYNYDFDMSDFSFDKLTDKLISILN